MASNTDGNLAALNVYQSQQDAIADDEAHLERLQQDLADDLYDGYITGNSSVVDEVNDALLTPDTTDNLIDRLRYAMAVECKRPLMGRGGEIYGAYSKLIAGICEAIAKKYGTPYDIYNFRKEFDL